MDEYLEANRQLWESWTRINLESRFYDVEEFAAGRGRDLDPIARAGPGDVRGKSLLHLQCHLGMDTIRWARHGATVTGADFSAAAITAARALAARMGVPATFVHSDLYELPSRLDGRFDVVFTSHGVLGWLPDLERWARVIAHFLAPDGLFYIVEAHPFALLFNDRLQEPDLRLLYPYFHGQDPIRQEYRGCYTDPDAPITSVEHVWLHTMSEVIGSLLRAGLRLESFEAVPRLAVVPLDGAARRWLVASARPRGAAPRSRQPAADVLAQGDQGRAVTGGVGGVVRSRWSAVKSL